MLNERTQGTELHVNDDDERSFKEKLDFRIAIQMIDRAFEKCNSLSEADKNLLYKEVANRVLQQIPHVPGETHLPADDSATRVPADENETHVPADNSEAYFPADSAPAAFRDRCLELAVIAPAGAIRDSLLLIVELFDTEAKLMDDKTSSTWRS
jgi:hypothetical protein